MMHKTLTLPEIRRAGLEALYQSLGPAGMIRFLQLYDPGKGDYTKERKTWLKDLTIDEVVENIQKHKR